MWNFFIQWFKCYFVEIQKYFLWGLKKKSYFYIYFYILYTLYIMPFLKNSVHLCYCLFIIWTFSLRSISKVNNNNIQDKYILF